MELLINALESVYRETLGHEGFVPMHEPCLSHRESQYVQDCVETGWVSSVGSYVDRFEEMIAEAAGRRFGVAIVNGTAAQHLLLTALGIGPGDLVICPAISFVATANAIRHTGADPVFVDIEDVTLGICPTRLEEFLTEDCYHDGVSPIMKSNNRRVRALVAVHVFGHPCQVFRVQEICKDHDLAFIEDAAEAIGSSLSHNDEYRPAGSISDAAFFSFNGNKIITTGGGGAIVTDDENLAQNLKHLSTTARQVNGFEIDHDAVGFNYRLPNINAALGCAQLEQLDQFIAQKRLLHDMLRAALEPLDQVKLLCEQPWATSNYWLNALVFGAIEDRDTALAAGQNAQLQMRPAWKPLPSLQPYLNAPRARTLFTAFDIGGRIVNIPSGQNLMANHR